MRYVPGYEPDVRAAAPVPRPEPLPPLTRSGASGHDHALVVVVSGEVAGVPGKRGMVLGAAVTLAAGLAAYGGVASAQPQPTVSQVQAQVNKLQAQVDQVGNQYDTVTAGQVRPFVGQHGGHLIVVQEPERGVVSTTGSRDPGTQ